MLAALLGGALGVAPRLAPGGESLVAPTNAHFSAELASAAPPMPHFAVAFGKPRTATTLQFAGLCGAMFLHADDPTGVECKYGGAHLLPKGFHANTTGKGKWLLLKSHDNETLAQNMTNDLVDSEGNKAWLFTTSSNATAGLDGNYLDWKPTADIQAAELGYPVKYTQVVQLLDARGYLLGEDYARMYGLDATDTDSLLSYLRYWDPIRQCCGLQMTDSWRQVRLPLADGRRLPPAWPPTLRDGHGSTRGRQVAPS